jgi:pimeloyl-ACP methyl ester carboxylesterase
MNQEIALPEGRGTEFPAVPHFGAAKCHGFLQQEPPALVVAEAMAQFEREAEPDVFFTGRYHCPYFMWGHGPPLVFVHGLCDDARSFVLPISILGKHFRCIAYDLPTGRHDGARLGRYRPDDYVDDLFRLLDHWGIDHTDLYGSSFGSSIVLKALHKSPERFGGVVIQGGFARRPLARAEILLARLARYWPGPMGRLPWRNQILRYSHYHAFARREPAAWENYLRRVNGPPMAAVARRALTVHATDLRALLPYIRQPVLLLCGSADPLVSRTCEDELLHGLPDVTRAEIQGCGHYPYFSHPEIMAELIQRFLTPLPCDAP